MDQQDPGTPAPGTQGTGSQPPALPSLDEIKAQASQAGEGARTALSTMAADARARLDEIIQHQKEAGADHLSGFAHAAETAAGDLAAHNPTAARLFKDAASSVDHLADNLRNSDVRDVLASVTDFARRQPVAFFAGTVLAGFVLARFIKSEAQAAPAAPRPAAEPGSGFRAWSEAHPDSDKP